MSMVITSPPGTFALGQCAVSKAVQDKLGIPKAYALLARHAKRDWGDSGMVAQVLNDGNLETGTGVIVSIYASESVIIVTEPDHSATVVQLTTEEKVLALRSVEPVTAAQVPVERISHEHDALAHQVS